jgi:hypothetical protein
LGGLGKYAAVLCSGKARNTAASYSWRKKTCGCASTAAGD